VVQINIVPGRLVGYRIPATVGIDGCLRYISNILLVERDHFSWQCKNGQPVDTLVGEKTPAYKKPKGSKPDSLEDKNICHAIVTIKYNGSSALDTVNLLQIRPRNHRLGRSWLFYLPDRPNITTRVGQTIRNQRAPLANMRQIRTAIQKHGFFDNETKNSLGVVFAIPPNPFTFALLFLEQTLWQTISQQKKEYAQTRRNE
jgi:hypothetical protein